MSNENVQSESDPETQPIMPSPAKAEVKLSKVEADRILVVGVWMVFSSMVVIYNKWVFSAGGFPYPLALTCLHMTSCFLIFGAVKHLAPTSIRNAIMPDADVEISWSIYFRNFVGISVFYAGTLGTGNLAYLFSSVAFIQMMKPANCIFASLAAFALGVETPTHSHIIIVCIIAFGVVFASHHTTQFSLTGTVLQVISSSSEGCRLAMVQAVTTSGVKVDPVTTVYHFSLPTAVLLGLSSLAIEKHIDTSKLLSPWIIVLNCAMAVILNVLVANVIKKTSAVVFALSGIVKDMGIIVASSVFFMTPITRLMLLGYSISVCGLCMFKAYKDNTRLFAEKGFIGGMSKVSQLAARQYGLLQS